MINTRILVSIVLGLVFTTTVQAHEKDKKKNNDDCFDVSTMTVVEYEEEIDLGFNPYYFLPHDFDPYVGMPLNLNEIVLIEDEEEIELDFDVNKYLPENFNPYLGQ